MTCEGARRDLKVVRRGWKDGGRIQPAEIRLMYYDISRTRLMCTRMLHLRRISLGISVVWVLEKDLMRNKKKRGRRRIPSVKICTSCIKLVCSMRPNFRARRGKDVVAACDSDLNVNRFSKELLLDRCLHLVCGIWFSWQWKKMPAKRMWDWMAWTCLRTRFLSTFISTLCSNQT